MIRDLNLLMLTNHPPEYWKSHIIMPTLIEAVSERMVGRDEVDGIQLDMTKIEAYLKQLVLWIRIRIMAALLIPLVSIAVLN